MGELKITKKLNMKKLGIFCSVILVLIIILIFVIYGAIKDYKISQTYEYKLNEIGYTENEIKIIKDKLNNEQMDKILKSKYNKNLSKFLKEKYFIYNNLEKYLDYANENASLETTKIVSIINTQANNEWYKDIKETDISKNELMLVNKFNKLKEDYVPEDLITVSGTYGYSGKKVSKSIYNQLTSMLDSAKTDGFTMLVEQGYRSYEDQADAYKSIEDANGQSVADKQAARAGHSEYQTGLSISLNVYKVEEGLEASEGATWLQNNSYKYGFIIRYPENTSDITGFKEEKWRLRYVGTEAAKKIYEDNITFDEYYAYYINK